MKRLTLFLILVLALPIGVKAFDVSGRDKATVVGLLVGAKCFQNSGYDSTLFLKALV